MVLPGLSSGPLAPSDGRLSRRGFLLAAGAAVSAPALAQVDVGEASNFRSLIPAGQIEGLAQQQYAELISQARRQGVLAQHDDPQLNRLRAIARRLIPQAARWNGRASQWRWEVNLLQAPTVNAFCMPGGKIAFFSGLLDRLELSGDEAAIVMGHEIAHAVREHARARLAKTQSTGIGLSVLSQVLGLGQLGDLAAQAGTKLLSLSFSRGDEIDADLVGLELAARGAYRPDASISLWEKMQQASQGRNVPSWRSTHPTGPDRIARLRENVPKVQGLYEQAARGG